MAIKVGDRVRVSENCDNYVKPLIGCEFVIEAVNADGTYELKDNGYGTRWRRDEIELIKGENNMSVKYYRNLKDNFLWQEGAILSDEKNCGNDGGYQPVTDLFDKTEANDGEYISRRIVEHDDNKDMFERVYPIGDLKKMLFGNKKAAQAAMSAGAFKAKPAKK